MPKTCPTCGGARRVQRQLRRAWWQVLLMCPSVSNELCDSCMGCGIVKGTPEEEREFEQQRQRRAEGWAAELRVNSWISQNDYTNIENNWGDASAVLRRTLEVGSGTDVVHAAMILIRHGDYADNFRLMHALNRMHAMRKVLGSMGGLITEVETLAALFLNCGNAELERDVREWARRNEYSISRGSASHLARWGSAK